MCSPSQEGRPGLEGSSTISTNTPLGGSRMERVSRPYAAGGAPDWDWGSGRTWALLTASGDQVTGGNIGTPRPPHPPSPGPAHSTLRAICLHGGPKGRPQAPRPHRVVGLGRRRVGGRLAGLWHRSDLSSCMSHQPQPDTEELLGPKTKQQLWACWVVTGPAVRPPRVCAGAPSATRPGLLVLRHQAHTAAWPP